MNFKLTSLATLGLAAGLALGLMHAPASAQAPDGKQAAKGKGGINRPPDPRVQQRKYHFTDTNEELAYAVYASSKVSKDKNNPLIIALHGLGGDENSLMRGNALELAEEGGYILVGPLGYNPRGWYGTPVGTPRAGKGVRLRGS